MRRHLHIPLPRRRKPKLILCPSWVRTPAPDPTMAACDGANNHAGLHYHKWTEDGIEIVWDNGGHYTVAPIAFNVGQNYPDGKL